MDPETVQLWCKENSRFRNRSTRMHSSSITPLSDRRKNMCGMDQQWRGAIQYKADISHWPAQHQSAWRTIYLHKLHCHFIYRYHRLRYVVNRINFFVYNFKTTQQNQVKKRGFQLEFLNHPNLRNGSCFSVWAGLF